MYLIDFGHPADSEMKKRDVSDGFRRILYDAMVLSASLRAIRECNYYQRWKTPKVDGYVEAHQVNAMIQIRSMIDFLNCRRSVYQDTMTAVQFFGCTEQTIPFPERKASDKYAAHKSWDAVAKNAAAGARQFKKSEVVALGMKVLDGFDNFQKECLQHLKSSFNDNAKRYKEILEENRNQLKRQGA